MIDDISNLALFATSSSRTTFAIFALAGFAGLSAFTNATSFALAVALAVWSTLA
jgi:hypothetical protein